MPRPSPLIQDQRVYLRHPYPLDRDEFLEVRRISRDLHLPWEPLPEDGLETDGVAAFNRFLEFANTPQSQKHLICRIDDDAILGYVGLGQIFMGPFCSAYMGYWMGLPFIRCGYCTAGVLLCLKRAFTDLGLHRVEANIIPNNTASLATARRCGFLREGYSPRYLKIAGLWQDHERWALTYEDWQALQPHQSANT